MMRIDLLYNCLHIYIIFLKYIFKTDMYILAFNLLYYKLRVIFYNLECQ